MYDWDAVAAVRRGVDKLRASLSEITRDGVFAEKGPSPTTHSCDAAPEEEDESGSSKPDVRAEGKDRSADWLPAEASARASRYGTNRI